jgi:hypothetical protein
VKDKFKSFSSIKSKDKELSVSLKKDENFRNQTSDKIMKFIDMLGYDLATTSIYATINNKTFQSLQWFEATDFSRPKMYYDVKQKNYFQGRECFFVQDHILKHSFPLEIKNKKKFKHYNLYQNSIPEDILLNMQYMNNDMCGCYLKKQSDILCIDIDNHNNEGSLYTYQILFSFIEFIKTDPVYMEISSSGGYHAFFKLDKQYSIENKKSLLSQFKEKYGYSLELPTKLRFPNSLTYEPITKEHEVLSYLGAIDYSISVYNKKESIVIENKTIEPIIEIKEPKVVSSVFTRDRTCNIKHITPEEALSDNSLCIEKGNRVLPMLKIIRTAKFNNWTKEDTLLFIRKMDSNINPSHDLSIWSDIRLMKEIETMWVNCKMVYREKIDSQVSGFISNIDKIPSHILKIIDKRFINTIMNQVYQNSKQYRYSNKNYKSFSIIIKEMIGTIYYNSHNNRKVKSSHTNHHIVGTQYSIKYCEELKNHYSELKNTNVWEIVNCILLQSNLFEQYFINKRGWRYNPKFKENNYCRQFDLFNNKNHILLNSINHISFIIINSIKEYIVRYNFVKKCINNIINIITYYSQTFYDVVHNFSLFPKDNLLLLT